MNSDELLPLCNPNSGCDYHRIVLPLTYAGYTIPYYEKLTRKDLDNVKAIMFNRTPLNIKLDTIARMKEELGIRIVMDVDDYWELPASHYLHKTWAKNNVTNSIKRAIGLADTVFCTTDRLAAKIRLLNSNVEVIPNALPFDSSDQFAFDREDSKVTRFGFVGGPSHTGDLRSIGPVFQHFNHLNFTLCGVTVDHPESLKMQAICSNNMKNPNYSGIQNTALDKYMYGYDGLDCCVAPLADMEFNKYKSNLKVIEAGRKKCAIICSPVACYTDTVPDTVVTYCKSIKDWKAAIKKHQDIDYTREKGESLFAWTKENYNLSTVNNHRIDALNNMTNYEKLAKTTIPKAEVPVAKTKTQE